MIIVNFWIHRTSNLGDWLFLVKETFTCQVSYKTEIWFKFPHVEITPLRIADTQYMAPLSIHLACHCHAFYGLHQKFLPPANYYKIFRHSIKCSLKTTVNSFITFSVYKLVNHFPPLDICFQLCDSFKEVTIWIQFNFILILHWTP